MLLTTTDSIRGKSVQELGLVRGETVQSKHMGKDIMAGFKTVVGGEIKSYTEMITEARDIATQRMIADAERLGADAIVAIRYASSSVMAGASEILAYGTAVKFL